VPLSWGACEGVGPLRRSREASFRADPATECGSNPIARSKYFKPFRSVSSPSQFHLSRFH